MMRCYSCALLASILALLSLPSLCTAQDQPEYVPGVVVVQFSSEVAYKAGLRTGLQEFDRSAARYEVHTIERTYPFLDHVEPTPKTRQDLLALRRTYYVRYHANVAPERVAEDLGLPRGVVYAEPVGGNRTLSTQADAVPNDPKFIHQLALQWLRLPEAWDVVKGEDGSPRVVIAIVDGGGLWNHEDLLDNVWTNSDEVPNNGIDDDQNGFVDDVHGWNFCMRMVAGRCISGPDPYSVDLPGSASHGTLVAGIAGAVTDNGVGIAGAAWNADLMHLGVGGADDSLFHFAYEGIMYAAVNGADIINASFGSSQESSFERQTTELATDMGALIVAGTGNDSQNLGHGVASYPAMYPRVLSVGATSGSRLASLSNYGRGVDVFAPGVDLESTESQDRGSYGFCTGTSCAAPLVSGVAALVKTKHPDWTPDMIREHIRLTAENIDAYNPGYEGQLGHGLVNALAAVGGDVTEDMDVAAVHEALRALYNSTNGDQWRDNTGWDTVPPSMVFFDEWYGLTVRNGRLVSIELGNNHLIGPIPPELGNLTDLEQLILYSSSGVYNWNQLTGPIPPELGNLTNLTKLRLGSNQLTGAIPPGLGNLTNLEWLFLNDNQLTGPIPPELGNLTNLERLHLSDNQLTGPITPELGNLTNLTLLSLGDNQTTGPIPPELGNLTNLRNLNLNLNQLTGPIPPELGNLTNLRNLNLNSNRLTGPIPSWLGNLTDLVSLLLDVNQLTGPIPPELGNLTDLELLYLDDNQLTGQIPPELGNLTNLKFLYLGDNQLTGPIPRSFLKLGSLWEFYFDSNENLCAPPDSEFQAWLRGFFHLNGSIPKCATDERHVATVHKALRALYNSTNGDQWRDNTGWDVENVPRSMADFNRWYGLQARYGPHTSGPFTMDNDSVGIYINLGHNQLTGPIPPELGNLTNLWGLHLPENQLTGPIPLELGNLPNLESLYLSDNQLTGPIPPELGNLTNLTLLHLGDNQLTGLIPPELGNLTNLESLHLYDNLLTGPIPPELGNLTELEWLPLHRNQLTGVIPPEFGNLTNLRGLYLSINQLTGVIPPELGNLTNLEWLTLNHNQLTGSIPPELGNLTDLEALYLHSNQLTGPIPRSFMKLGILREFHFDSNESLCAPSDAEFQAWLNGIQELVAGPNCAPSVSTEQETALPAEFTVQGSYPNPFRVSTSLQLDLPWPARVSVEVLDVTGRRVYFQAPSALSAGWNQELTLRLTLPAGVYLYLLSADTDGEGLHVQSGRFVKVR